MEKPLSSLPMLYSGFLFPFRCPSLHSIVIKKLENSMLGLWFYGFSKSVPLTVYQVFKSICQPGDISTIMGSEFALKYGGNP